MASDRSALVALAAVCVIAAAAFAWWARSDAEAPRPAAIAPAPDGTPVAAASAAQWAPSAASSVRAQPSAEAASQVHAGFAAAMAAARQDGSLERQRTRALAPGSGAALLQAHDAEARKSPPLPTDSPFGAAPAAR